MKNSGKKMEKGRIKMALSTTVHGTPPTVSPPLGAKSHHFSLSISINKRSRDIVLETQGQ